MSKKILVHEEIYTHEYLWSISNLMISEAKLNEKRAYYFYFSALLMSYMAFEAFINFCGYVLLPKVWENEKEYFMNDIKVFCQSILESMRKYSDHLHLFHDAFEGPLASSRGHTI